MQTEQTKSILVNIITGAVVVGILIVGYLAFSGGQQDLAIVPAETSVSEIASKTALIGSEIETTVKNLSDLNSAVASSVVIFSTPAFKNLQDFSAGITEQSVGRPNPFVLTSWKRSQSTEEADLNSSVPASTSMPQSGTDTTTVPATPSSADSLTNPLSTDLTQGI